MERIDDHVKTRSGNSNSGRLIVGLILLFAGAMMVAKHLHWIDYDAFHVIFSWPALLITIGTIGAINNKNNAINYIIIIIGLVFILGRLPGVHFDVKRLIWPFIFIFLGLLILTKQGRYGERFRGFKKEGSAADYIDDTLVFGGGRMNITSKEFKGGRITAIFGGSEYDFHQAEMADGKNILDVFHVFGGSKLLIPSDWDVKLDVISIFGGYSDKRMNLSESKNNKELIIKGLVIFGGGEIKSA
ncbi:LiaI-LiaF-like domain-containing protein [Bacteroidota bacterium]